MTKFIIEKAGEHKGFDYFIKFFNDGHRCGYVEVPLDNRFHGKNYSDIPIMCHGGLTFSENITDDSDGFTPGFWVGFDCAHYNDKPDSDKAREVFGPSKFIDIMERISFGDHVRDLEFVENECIRIIDQLVDFQHQGI